MTKQRFVIWITLILILTIIFPSFSIAGWGEDTDFLIDLLNSAVNLLSWLWVIPSIIAWTLMTNQLVFGEVIHLDVYLWQLWNIMKNFANFALWFIFLFFIFKTFFKWEPGSLIKSYLPKIWLAWIIIQATWFLVAAIIDITIIATTAVASLPHQFVQLNQEQWHAPTSIDMPAICYVLQDIQDSDTLPVNCEWDEDGNDISVSLDEINATAVNASGPLLYFGFNALKLQKFSSNEATSWDKITIGFLIKLFVILAFSIPLFVLMVINFIRIFWLWMFIIFSPFVVLDAVFGNAVTSKMEWATKKLTVSNFIWLAFQPVIVIWMLSIIMIFVVGLMNVFQNQTEAMDAQLWEIFGIFSDSEWGDSDINIQTLWEDSGSQIVLLWDFIVETGQFVWWVLWYLIMAIFVCVMVWSLIKVSFKTSEITSWVSQSMFKFWEEMMKTVPIVPWTQISVGALSRAKSRLSSEVFQSVQTEQARTISEWTDNLHWETGITTQDKRRLINAAKQNSHVDKLNAFIEEAKGLGKPLLLTNPKFKEAAEKAMESFANDSNISEDIRNRILDEQGNVNRKSDYTRALIIHMMQWNKLKRDGLGTIRSGWTHSYNVEQTDWNDFRDSDIDTWWE